MSNYEHLVSSLTCKLPGDVMVDILSRLPVKSLVQYKLVSKSWCALVENQDFSSMHLYRSSSNGSSSYIVISPYIAGEVIATKMYVISPTTNVAMSIGAPYEDLLKPVGSCNGLVCLTFYRYGKFGTSFVLCNPTIRDYKKVSPYICSRGEVVQGMKPIHVSLGFGFDSKANDYKIVRIEQFNAGNGQIHTECDVYSKAFDSWRNIQASLESVIEDEEHEMLLAMIKNYDALHWMATRNDDHHILVSFDITAEIFNEITVPREVLDTYNNNNRFLPAQDLDGHFHRYLQTWLDGSLMIFIHYYGTDGSRMTGFTIWRAKNGSWVQEPLIVLSGDFYYALASLTNGHFLFYAENFSSATLYMYDPTENNSDQIFGIPEMSHLTSAYAYKESLVTVNGINDRSRLNNRRRHGKLTRFFLDLMSGMTAENIFFCLFVAFGSFLCAWVSCCY